LPAIWIHSFSRSEKEEALPVIHFDLVSVSSPVASTMLSRSNLIRSRFVAASHRWLQSQRPYPVTNNTNANTINSTAQRRLLSCAAQSIAVADEDEIDDSFEILGLPRKFTVSPTDLKQSYRALMTKYHPDKHSSGMSEEVQDMASRITNAFQVLKEPHTRATHLLELVGFPVDETSQTDLVGMEFLMEVMELREDVDSTDPKYLKPIWEETKARIASIVENLDEAFEGEDYSKAMELASQLQYWRRIQTAIYEKMDLDN
jgi:molecular chaperone HscB